MPYEWDVGKAEANLALHGVAFEAVARFEMDAALIELDQTEAHDEYRFRAIGPLDGRLHVLVFTDRGETTRVISIRPAEKSERRRYVKAKENE